MEGRERGEGGGREGGDRRGGTKRGSRKEVGKCGRLAVGAVVVSCTVVGLVGENLSTGNFLSLLFVSKIAESAINFDPCNPLQSTYFLAEPPLIHMILFC